MKTTILIFGKNDDMTDGTEELDLRLLGDGKFNKPTCKELNRVFGMADQLKAMQFHVQLFDGRTLVFTAELDQERTY